MTNFETYFTSKAGLSEQEWEQLLPLVTTKNIDKGEIILQQGAICKHSFFVERGLLRSYTLDSSGKEHVLQFAPEDWIITDRSSVYFNEPSELYIDAIEDTEAVLLTEEFINAASAISEKFRTANQHLLQNHIRHLQKRIQLLINASAEERYLHFIKLYPDLLLRVPQWMIASYLGITPESLSRVRKQLAKKNFKTR